MQVRVDAKDLEALDRLAATHNVSRSDAFRRVLHHQPLPKALVDAKVYFELRQVGVNINQIAHSLNRGDDPDLEYIHEHLEHLEDRLDYISRCLCEGRPLLEMP